MLRPALICLVALASLSAGEYVWTGTEWKWQEPDSAGGAPPLPGAGGSSVSLGGGSSSEGSGNGNSWDDDYDDEDYDDNYTYDDDYEEPVKKKEDKKKFSFSDNNKKDKKKNKNKNNNNRNRNSEILPATDDEDLFEGSGASDFDLPRSNYPESDSNNYNNFNNPLTPVDQYNNNDNSNVYVDENDDSYDDEYDYDDEDYDDDDISFGIDTNNNYGNIDTTAKPMDPVINMNNNNNNVWNTPKPTERSFTPRVTTTIRPVSHGGAGAGTDVHKTVPVSRPASFFAQPGILAAVIGGAVVGLLCAILLVMFIVYRMRKKDEGSYALDEPKRSHNVNSYSKPPNREFYA